MIKGGFISSEPIRIYVANTDRQCSKQWYLKHYPKYSNHLFRANAILAFVLDIKKLQN